MFPHRPLNSLPAEDYNMIPVELFTAQHCVNCGKNYEEINNMGRLACYIHPGIAQFITMSNGYYYSCCNQSVGSRGCTRADHINEVYSLYDQEERDDALFSKAIVTIPIIYFQYGVKNPINDAVLYRPGDKQTSLVVKLPLTTISEVHIDISEKKEELYEAVNESSILSKIYVDSNMDVTNQEKALDMKWRNMLHVDKDREEERTLKNYDIPFVIIRRIAE